MEKEIVLAKKLALIKLEYEKEGNSGGCSARSTERLSFLARKYKVSFVLAIRFIESQRKKEVELHLNKDDCMTKGESPAIVHSRNTKRYLRKNEERFNRMIRKSKSARRAKLGNRHGWQPVNDVRHLGNY